MTDEEMDCWYRAARALQDFARERGELDLADTPLIDLVEALQAVSRDKDFVRQVESKSHFN